VLVVDDSNTIRRSAEIFLKQGGHEVMLADDGFDALAKVNDFEPELIFCDILMPRLDGYQACSTGLAAAWSAARTTSPNPSPRTSC
jgi:twitching motility two-component system response regulator PilG